VRVGGDPAAVWVGLISLTLQSLGLGKNGLGVLASDLQVFRPNQMWMLQKACNRDDAEELSEVETGCWEPAKSA
jgi:hypothetical protein